MRIFWRLHQHRCGGIRIIAYQIPGLSVTKLIFQDFPGPGNFTNTIPGLSRRRENPANWSLSAMGHLGRCMLTHVDPISYLVGLRRSEVYSKCQQ